MLSLGSSGELSDDEDMMIVSLVDFDGEEEEDEEDDDEDSRKALKKCLKTDASKGEAKSISFMDSSTIDDEAGGNEKDNDKLDNNSNINKENSNTSLCNQIVNGNSNDSGFSNGGDDADDEYDMVPSISCSFIPSIPTIDEEEGEDGCDDNGGSDLGSTNGMMDTTISNNDNKNNNIKKNSNIISFKNAIKDSSNNNFMYRDPKPMVVPVSVSVKTSVELLFIVKKTYLW